MPKFALVGREGLMRIGVIAMAASCALLVGPRDGVGQIVATPQMQAFTSSKSYESIIARTVASIPETVFKRCPALVSNSSQVILLTPVTFGAGSFPNSGRWKQAFPVSGCGDDKILNLYFTASVDEKITVHIAAPGTTRADVALQRDTLLYAKTGAAIAAKDCKDFVVANTRFEAFGTSNPPIPDPGPSAPRRPWSETWIMAGCGQRIDVPISFIPEATGTRIVGSGGQLER